MPYCLHFKMPNYLAIGQISCGAHVWREPLAIWGHDNSNGPHTDKQGHNSKCAVPPSLIFHVNHCQIITNKPAVTTRSRLKLANHKSIPWHNNVSTALKVARVHCTLTRCNELTLQDLVTCNLKNITSLTRQLGGSVERVVTTLDGFPSLVQFQPPLHYW